MTFCRKAMIHDGGRFQSGQMGRTVNPLSFDFRGSNPLLPTFILKTQVGKGNQ